MNLEIDQCINYSHRFKLINDEIQKFDSSSNKNKGKGKKRMGPKESSYMNAVNPGFQPQYSQQYYNQPGGHPVYYQNDAPGMVPNMQGSGSGYPVNYQVPHQMTGGAPMSNYPGAMSQSYTYQPNGYNQK